MAGDLLVADVADWITLSPLKTVIFFQLLCKPVADPGAGGGGGRAKIL